MTELLNDYFRRKIEELERRIQQLEQAGMPFGPITKPFMPHPYKNWENQVEWAKYPKCGIKLDKVMGYCCNQSGCQTGLGGPIC